MRQNGIRPAKFRFEKGGRVGKMGGGMSTKRKDMASGYYKDDMGMDGGAMYKKGGSVKKKAPKVAKAMGYKKGGTA